MSEDEDAVEVCRWYTHTRKFPQFVGKTHNGGSLWGGPYTFTQIGVFVAIVWLGSNTYWLWGRSDIVTNAVTLVAVAYSAALLAGKLPIGLRSPLSVLIGVWRSFTSPSTGRYAGGVIHLAKPHQVVGRTQLLLTHPETPHGEHQQATDTAEVSIVAAPFGEPQPAVRRPALSNVQLLLASTTTPN